MTTHSVCHPGRPSPHGDGQVGSPGLPFFQRAKSSGSRFLSSTSTRAPASCSSLTLPDSLPYPGKLRTEK